LYPSGLVIGVACGAVAVRLACLPACFVIDRRKAITAETV